MLHSEDLPSLYLLDHPLVYNAMARLRDKTTDSANFRAAMGPVAAALGLAATEDLPMTTTRIETPLEDMDAPVTAGKSPVMVGILRAGLGLVTPLRAVFPHAPEGHIGLARDPVTKEPTEYLVKLPPLDGRAVILADPMLATGNSAAHAVRVLVKANADPKQIRLLAVVAAPEGVRRVAEEFPDVRIFAAVLDRGLDENAYIRPGLGDAGDRLFATPHD